MGNDRITRRDFIRDGALTAASIGAAVTVGVGGVVFGAAGETFDTSRILNYNSNMEYRRLGKTGLMVSAVCLGGHSRSNQEQRNEIVSRAIDAGINYIDACWDNEVKRDAKALEGRRDRMYLALSHGAKEMRNEDFRTSEKLLASLDELLQSSGQEYTDLWRITCYEPGGRHTFNAACEMVDALEKAKKQGKARFIGFSTHDRRWIKFMIEYFPQIDCVCFPFTTMSRRAQTDSVFDALQKCDIGAFGIKPFAAGSLFTEDRDENLRGPDWPCDISWPAIPSSRSRALTALTNLTMQSKRCRSGGNSISRSRLSWRTLLMRRGLICLKITSGSRIGSTCRIAGSAD